ncbi:MAG: molybdopterin-dependent oxidoreductase [Acidiferrobacterales bacterium]
MAISRNKTAPGVDTTRGVYAPTENAGWLNRFGSELGRIAKAALLGRPGPEQHPYTALGKPPRADRVIIGACPICFNSCPVKYHLAGDRLTTITGVETDPVSKGRLCPKGQFQIQMYYSPDRLTRPLKRVGPRGEDRFEPIDWDQALDEVADRLKRVRERYGSKALAIFTGTRSSWMNKAGGAALFAELFGTPNQEGTAPLCASAASQAFMVTQGCGPGGNSFTETDLGSATYYLLVGDNMAETRPVYFGLIHDCRINNGARMVVVDPRQSATAAKADEWIAIRPGTDMALALGMMFHLVERGLLNTAFLERRVAGWERLCEFLREMAYTPAWAASITEIPETVIRRLAEELASAERAVIFGGKGLNQHTNGFQTNRVFHMLCLLAGHWGRPGAGFMNLNRGLPLYAHAPDGRAPQRGPALRKSPSGWIDAMVTGRPYPIKAFITTGNPLSTWPGQAKLREAMEHLDLVVYMELFPHATSYFADYVFPTTSAVEAGDVNRSNDDRRVGWIEKCIDGPGEARSDLYFWIELGKRFGFDDVLRDEYKNDPPRFWDEMMISAQGVQGLTTSRMKASPSAWIRGPIPEPGDAEVETLFQEGSTFPGDPRGRCVPTPTGKFEIWTEALEERFRPYGLSPLPQFYTDPDQLVDLPHLEYLASDEEEGVPSPIWNGQAFTRPVRIVSTPQTRNPEYDTELISGRPPAPHFHSWTHWFWQANEMWPEQFVMIHPDKADQLGIRDRDRVIIENQHGAISAVAWVHPGIRKSTIFVPIGWDERQRGDPAASVNWLIDHHLRDPISDQTNMKSLLVRLRKA